MTYQTSELTPVPARRATPSRLRYSVLPLGLLLASCGDGPMSVGSNDVALDEPPRRCNGGIIARDVTADDQAAIDELLGCEVIDGNLSIRVAPIVQADTSLAALASLRFVRGSLTIRGAGSLAGLEALEQVGNLSLTELASEDLRAFESLERVVRDPPGLGEGGAIRISDCNNLRNLRGLEHLTTWSSLNITQLPALESLSGLAGPPRLEGLFLTDTPALRTLSGLGFARDVDYVSISSTGLESLDGFALSRTETLVLNQNHALENLDGLGPLQSVEQLIILDNDGLVRADIADLGEVYAISILENDALQSVPSYTGGRGHAPGLQSVPLDSIDSLVVFSTQVFEVANNASLTSIKSPVGYLNVDQVAISGNPNLLVLDLDALNRADSLSIRDNPRLNVVGVASLERVGDLQVVDNPQLSMAEFGGVQTFSRTMSGNLDAPAP